LSKYRNVIMNSKDAIGAFGALAHQHRLAAYRELVKRGSVGLAAGDIAERVGLLPSTLTFHLQSLQRAGLIRQRRDGRQLIYSADIGAMNALLAYITDNCCAESGETCGTDCAPPRSRTSAKPRKAA
jgi:ArsR family transcriptional regulator, arsenate/arsenite/antimonite-responsive transcriptional repressor